MRKMQSNLISILLLSLFILSIMPTMVLSSEYQDGFEIKPKLIIGDDINYPPYSYLDSTGNPAGFNIDLAKAVGQSMGYEVEIRLDEWSKIRDALETGEIDAIAGMFYSIDREKIYGFSSKHSVTNGDIFTKKDTIFNGLEDLTGKTIVVQRADIVAEHLSHLDLNIHLVEVATVDEALRLVENGTYAYAGILKLPGLYSIASNGFKDIQPQGLMLTPNDYCMAVSKENQDLLLVLNGGLQIIKATGEYQQIYDKWMGIYEEKSLLDIMKEYYWILLIVLIIVLILLGVSLILKHMVNVKTKELQEANRNLKYLSFHDQLTGIYNRHFFEIELKRLDTPENLPLSIVMADVNGLKLVNDSFGHKVGDQLLIRVAEVLQEACRRGEIISRIGGDEFVILIPRMEKNQTEGLIDRINTIIEKEQVSSVNLSISFGWEVKYSVDENIQEIFNRAENFMYKQKLFESPSMRGKTITAIINTLHEKNKREEEHSQRVSDLCRKMAQVLNFSEREIDEIKTVGLLHDIGKISINEDILNKPHRLTDEEFEEIKRHPEIGYRILSSVNDMADLADYVLYHHEWWNGKGYPRGLKGEDIPIQARIIAIVDAFDAMTSHRTYREARSEEEAILELIKNKGIQFDPNLTEAFISKVLGYSNLLKIAE